MIAVRQAVSPAATGFRCLAKLSLNAGRYGPERLIIARL
jgi:hypothetical protein